jgi:hypothetical protein
MALSFVGKIHFIDFVLCSSNKVIGLSFPIARVPVAWMATVNSQGWVYATLEMGAMKPVVRNWRKLHNQIHFYSELFSPKGESGRCANQ